MAKGSQAAALTANQSRDALAAIQRLEELQHSIGRRVSLLAAVSEFSDASTKLRGRNLSEVVEGYLSSIGNVKRKDIAEAVEDFIKVRKPLTEAKAGKRAQLSPNYVSSINLWLRGFATTFPSQAVCDLTKEHLNLFMQKFSTQSPKSRNHYRGAIKQFLKWCTKQDYLSRTHRLLEADSMATEVWDIEDIDYYRPQELQSLLEKSGKAPVANNPDFRALLPVLALRGLAGLRLEEILRLDWADVWRVAGNVEVKALKAKTRSRRLVEIGVALAAWLKPYQNCSGAIFADTKQNYHQAFRALRESLTIPERNNGFRHGFCTYHFALHANENLTAQQSGNSPKMIHEHYKGLATKAEAENWFAVMPPVDSNSNNKKHKPNASQAKI